MSLRTAIVCLQAATFMALFVLLLAQGDDWRLALAQGLLAIITVLVYV
jgi:hypothetical protein